MGESDSRLITEARIAVIDKQIPSPKERAELIFEHLRSTHPDWTDWDILCFAGEFVALMSMRYLWLQEPAKRVVGMIYAAHYMNPETIDAASSIKRSTVGVPNSNKPLDTTESRNGSGQSESSSPGPVQSGIRFERGDKFT